MKVIQHFFLVTILFRVVPLWAQLDTIHWLPPMHARNEVGPQYIYLSTPEVEPFLVEVRDGSGALITDVMISNSQPYRHSLGSSANTPVLVTEGLLHKPLTGKGLVITGAKKFYAYFRVHASSMNHAGDLTCKGRAALGTTFRIGHLLQESDGQDRRANFVGVLATEDSTVVSLSDFSAQTDFRIGGTDVPSSGPQMILLQRGESVVFSNYVSENNSAQPPNGLMGALLESNHPVAVSCGSWVGAPVIAMAHDIGIDQIVPFELVGKESLLCRGNGSEILEHPIVIAHVAGTKVFLNGNNYPSATLGAGDHFIVPTNAFSADGNLFIRTTEPVFMYQMIGGTAVGMDAARTAGLIFVPPISCNVPNSVDNIYQPNLIGSMRFEGGLMITAMRDSSVTVRLDGNVIGLGAAASVPGNPDFVTYRKLDLFYQSSNITTISVVAAGAVQVAMYGRNEPASFAAFYSGFSKSITPSIDVSLVGDGVCPDTLVANGVFDGVQWVYEDSIIQYGPDTFLIAYVPGRYTAIGYLGVCRKADYASDSLVAEFNSPAFPLVYSDPSCYGFSNGLIQFGNPYGGFTPYQYSIDNGLHFSASPIFPTVTAGNYNLLVRDSTGCYNRPMALALTQPDSFSVELVPLLLPDPLKPGDRVELEAQSTLPVTLSTWSPSGSNECPDCLTNIYYPQENTWISVTVYDAEGCPAVDSLYLLVDPNIYAPNVFSPASVTGNAYFTLFSKAALPILELSVYDRWGEQMFQRQNFSTNVPEQGWDGKFRDKEALPGVYVFIARVEYNPGKVAVLKGDILLFR
ncbi:MAG: gliding motility-associated C-terminal domain-containing protein [Saprospiraceae bacterium]|nr:gliding motility-associated C-terminal domain-containing protein [Saprospiraceae bacterium]